jgi:hypothetical protein
MINKALDALLMLALAFCTLAIIAPHAAFAEADSVVYGSVYVDGSPVSGVIVTCGDQSTTTLRSGNYVFNLDAGITVQVLAIYDGYFASSDEFVTSALPTRKDLNIAIPYTPTPTPTPAPFPQTVYVTVTVTPVPADTSTPVRAQSPGFGAALVLLCLAFSISILSRKGR